MDAEPSFVDTNVLVYASRTRAPLYQSAVTCLQQAREQGRSLWLNWQVLREYLAAVTRPQSDFPALDRATGADIEEFLCDFNVAEDGPRVTATLLDLLVRHHFSGRQVHDANIVATMLEYGLRRLLTFNTADFRRFADVIDLEPLPAP